MRRPLVLLVLSLGASTCVREDELVDRFVEEYCAARWACGCDSPGLTEVHCVSRLTIAGNEAQQAAQEAGLEYDRECARAWLDAIDDSCAVQLQPDSQLIGAGYCGSPCLPYHGNQPKGAPCEEIGPWSDCAKGLHCGVHDTCEDPCDRLLKAGEECVDYDITLACAPGLVCAFDGTCGPPPTIGQPCGLELECAPGGTCVHSPDEWVCVEAPGFGEPCSRDECGASLRCEDGTCTAGSALVCNMRSPW